MFVGVNVVSAQQQQQQQSTKDASGPRPPNTVGQVSDSRVAFQLLHGPML